MPHLGNHFVLHWRLLRSADEVPMESSESTMSPWLPVALGAGVFSAVVNLACNASYLRAFGANVTYSAEQIRSNDECPSVDEFVANIKGHCAEFGRRAWLMALELREENELRAVEDHNCVADFDAALSRYSAWKQRQNARSDRVPVQSRVAQSAHSSRSKGRALTVGGTA